MKNQQLCQNRTVYTCEIPGDVLGSLECVLAYSMRAERPNFEAATEAEKENHIVHDLKAVENWYFESNLRRKPSRWVEVVHHAIIFALMGYVTFDLLGLRFDEAICFLTALGLDG